ncbi:hypothetical protein ACIPI6_14865 [Pseudomonas protegens]|uniref:hypothetical protein n=1 Tax=Pseudomonas protegens TaxID=380021 RepID=UPI0037F83C0D
MTVSTIDSVVSYDAGGPGFPIPYRFLQNSDIEAVVVKQDGTSETLTSAQYTLTGAGAQNGGTLFSTYAASILSSPGNLLTISRVMLAVQPTDLRNQGRYFAETHENVFDRLTMLIQQGFSGLSRALKRPIGKSYFDAEGRLISNVADPVDPQDVVTKNWVTLLLDSVSGVVNTTTGILYDAGTLFDYLRFGVARSVNSIAALRMLSSARNQRAFVLGYYVNGDGGGGEYFIDPTDTTSVDNGGTIIVASDGARWKLSTPLAFNLKQFGAKFDGVTNDNTAWVNAFTYAVATTGVSIAINAGKSVVTGNIPLGSGGKNIIVKGAGRASRLLWAATAPLFISSGASCDELSFSDFVIDNTGISTSVANSAFSFPEGNTRTDFNNVHLLPNLATNKTAPSFYLCPPGKVNDSINFFNCYAFINKNGIQLGAGSAVWIVGGRMAGFDPTIENSFGIRLTGGMGGVWVVGTDIIGCTNGIYLGQESGITNRELFLMSACTDSCNNGLSINDSGSYTSWTGCWAASCNIANISYAPTTDAAILNIVGGTIFNAGANDSGAVFSNNGVNTNLYGKLIIDGVEIRNNKGRGISCNSGLKTALTKFSNCNIHDNGTFGRAGSVQFSLAGNVSFTNNDISSTPATLATIDSASSGLMDIHDNRGFRGISLRTPPTLGASNVDVTNNTGQRLRAYFRDGAVTSVWKNGNPVASSASAAAINVSVTYNPGDTIKWIGTAAPSVQWDFE